MKQALIGLPVVGGWMIRVAKDLGNIKIIFIISAAFNYFNDNLGKFFNNFFSTSSSSLKRSSTKDGRGDKSEKSDDGSKSKHGKLSFLVF